MLDNKINSSSVETQENQPEGSLDVNKMMQNSSNLNIANDHKKLKERITDLLKGDTEFSEMKQGDKALVVGAASGLFTAVLPLLAVGATLAIPGAIVGLALYFAVKVAVKAVQSGYKGLKWSAEKTVEGAKYSAGKIKEGAKYSAEKTREGYHSVKGAISSVGKAIKNGTGTALGEMGRSLSNLGESMSSLDSIPYSIGNNSKTVVLKTKEKTGNFDSVKEMFVKEVFEDKAVNSSALTKEIFSKLGEKILEKAYSVDGQQSAKKDRLINQLKQQVDFVNKLDAKKLQNLLSKDNNSLYEIFSDHHDEIKRIVGECKREYEFDQSVRPNNAKDAEERKDSTQSTSSLPESTSMDSVRTESTISSKAELLDPANRKEVKQSSGFFSRFKRNETPKEATNVEYQTLSESDMQHRKIGKSTFYVDTPTESTAKTATIGGRPGVARRSSTSNLTRVETPEVPTRSASLTNLNGQSSFSEDVFSDPIVEQNLDSLSNRTLTHSNAVNSLASNCSFKSAASDHNGSDSAIGSSVPSTPERQRTSIKELEKEFDPLYKPSSSKNDVSVTGGIELKRS